MDMISVKKRFLEVCCAVTVFLGMFTVAAGINAKAASVNGWEVYGSNVTLTAVSATETRIAYAPGYNWTNSHAYLKNALFAPESGAGVVSFRFKADELADGDWVPFGICWAKDSESVGSLSVNGLKVSVTNSGGSGFVQFYENHPTKLTEDVAVSLTEYNTLTLVCGAPGSNQVDVMVNGTKAFTYTNADFYGMVAGANPTESMSLVVGGDENTAITVDTNASGWSAEGDSRALASIIGTPDYAAVSITGGNHASVYAKTADNAFKNQRTGMWGFDLKVPSFAANWAVLTLNWSLTGTPATSNSGLCFQLTPDSEGKYKIDPKFLESVAMTSTPASFSFAEYVRITIECTPSGDVTVKANGTTIGTAAGGASINYLYNEYPYAGFPGLTLSTGGDGAYSLIIKRFSAPADKTALNAKITECETNRNNTTVGSAIGQVPQDAMDTFNAAIDAAKAVANDEFVSQATVDSAVATLDAAFTVFKNAKIKAGDTSALQASITAAQKLLARLTEGSEKHTQLQTKLNQAVSVFENPNALQQELDTQKNELNSLVDQITTSTKFWTVSPEENEGIAVTVDGDRTTISNTKDIHSGSPVNIYSNIEKKDGKVIFNANIKKRKDFNDGIWQVIMISSKNEADTSPLARTGVLIGFGGTFGKSELSISHAGTKTQIGTYSFRENYEMQFNIGIETRNGTETLVIRIDGLEFATSTDAEIINVLKGDLIIGYTGAGNQAEGRDDYLSITEIDLNPAVVRPNKEMGEFIAAGPSGVGKTDGVAVTSDDDVQTLSFLADSGAFVNACARTNIKGPVTSFEYSVKINALIPGDWHALEFSNDFAHTGINSKGLSMAFAGSDNTVKFAEFYGDNGMGSPAGWELFAGIKLGKKMRIKVALEGNEVVCYLNGNQVGRNPASDKVKELFNSELITVALFGSASSDTEFEISYLNQEDPLPPDSLEEEPVYESTDIISLDDSLITVSGKEISVLKDMTIEEFKSLIYVEGDYSFAYYDKDGNEIADTSLSILKVARVAILQGTEEMDSYTILNQTGSAPADPVDTGVKLPITVFAVTVLAGCALLLLQKSKSTGFTIR